MSQQIIEENFEKLKSAREKLGLGQAEFAAKIPINRSYYSELESGKKPIQQWIIDKVEKIESEFDCKSSISSGVKNKVQTPQNVTPSEAEVFAGMSDDDLAEVIEQLTAQLKASTKAYRIILIDTLYDVASEFLSRHRNARTMADMAEGLAASGVSAVLHGKKERRPSSATDAPSAQTSPQAQGFVEHSKGQPAVQEETQVAPKAGKAG